ncbi:hypothetical protein VTI74DRAFT_7794 [Chaetomium olivicolor]
MLGLLCRFVFGWEPRHVRAQSQPQTCSFHLFSDGYDLSELPGGQVMGVPNPDAGVPWKAAGPWFYLKKGALYDTHDRGCWWVPPSTVLVCDLILPAVTDPFFVVEPGKYLVYNSTVRDFWACPADAGTKDGQQQQQGQQTTVNYYLTIPSYLQLGGRVESGNGHLGWNGVCRRVNIMVNDIDAYICNHYGLSGSSLSLNPSQ